MKLAFWKTTPAPPLPVIPVATAYLCRWCEIIQNMADGGRCVRCQAHVQPLGALIQSPEERQAWFRRIQSPRPIKPRPKKDPDNTLAFLTEYRK